MATLAPTAPKIFIIDDDDAVRDSLKILLEVHGLEVEDFGSTCDFVSHYRKPAVPGCLILDQHLPHMTGLDFLTSAKGREIDIPVILISGQGDAKLERRARDAGVADYLHKPISEQKLLETVQRAIA